MDGISGDFGGAEGRMTTFLADNSEDNGKISGLAGKQIFHSRFYPLKTLLLIQRSCFFLILAVWGAALPAMAAQDSSDQDILAHYGDAEFVSIATGSSKPVYKTPAVASVITAAQIKAMGARTLDEVLEAVPGLHVGLSSLNRLNPLYSIRGIHTDQNAQVLLLINGQPLTVPYSGGRPSRFRLPMTGISRVEVIRGPGSAVYGADAFAGVINVITKSAEEITGPEVGARYGSFDSTDLWLQQAGRLGDLDIALTLDWQKSNGDSDRVVNSDLQSQFDPDFSLAPGPLATQYEIFNAQLEFRYGDWTLRNWYWHQGDGGLGAGGAQALDPNGVDKNDTYSLDLSWEDEDWNENWGLFSTLGYIHTEAKTRFKLLPPGTTAPLGTDGNLLSFPPFTLTTFPAGLIGNPTVYSDQATFDLAAVYTGTANHRLRFGAGYKYQRETYEEVKNFGPGVSPGVLTDVSGTPYVFMPETSRQVWYLSVQDEWQLAPDWELTSGLRFDHYSDFGATVNPRLALVWETSYNLTSKLLYGRAFRAPSFSEQFAQNNPVILGNDHLDPETIDTVELAFAYRPILNLQTDLSIFTYRARELIEFELDAGGVTKTAQNARDQLGYGFEFEFEWQLSSALKLFGNYAWQHAEDRDSGSRIADAPGQQLYLAGEWKFWPYWSVTPKLSWIADRHRAPDDSRADIADYTLVDLTLRRSKLFEHFELAVAVRNLFDEDAREPSSGTIPDDYPLEGRNLWAELRYAF